MILSRTSPSLASRCSGALGGRPSNYLTGDMLRDSPDCLGPQGQPYPSKYIANMISRQKGRTGRTLDLQTIGNNDHRRHVPLTHLTPRPDGDPEDAAGGPQDVPDRAGQEGGGPGGGEAAVHGGRVSTQAVQVSTAVTPLLNLIGFFMGMDL